MIYLTYKYDIGSFFPNKLYEIVPEMDISKAYKEFMVKKAYEEFNLIINPEWLNPMDYFNYHEPDKKLTESEYKTNRNRWKKKVLKEWTIEHFIQTQIPSAKELPFESIRF